MFYGGDHASWTVLPGCRRPEQPHQARHLGWPYPLSDAMDTLQSITAHRWSGNAAQAVTEVFMSQVDVLVEFLSGGNLCRLRDILRAGVTTATVQRAVAAGLVERVSWGTYRRPGGRREAASHLAEALVRIPKGLVCMASAAHVHGLCPAPQEIWIGLPRKSSTPRVDWPPVRYVRYRNDLAFSVGVEVRVVSGVEVRITDPARTIADMLRMSDTVGEATALGCLRDYHERRHSAERVRQIAKELGWSKRIEPVLRVSSVMSRLVLEGAEDRKPPKRSDLG